MLHIKESLEPFYHARKDLCLNYTFLYSIIHSYWRYQFENVLECCLPFCYKQEQFNNTRKNPMQAINFWERGMSKWARAFRTWCQDNHDDHFLICWCGTSERGLALLHSNSSSGCDSLIMPVLFWQNYLLVLWKDQERWQHLFCNTSLLGILHSAIRRCLSGWSVKTKRQHYWEIKACIQGVSAIVPQLIFSI